MGRRPSTQTITSTHSEPTPKFCRMNQIQHANRVLESLGSSTRIGNLMNPALRQSPWDTSNLDRIDSDSE